MVADILHVSQLMDHILLPQATCKAVCMNRKGQFTLEVYQRTQSFCIKYTISCLRMLMHVESAVQCTVGQDWKCSYTSYNTSAGRRLSLLNLKSMSAPHAPLHAHPRITQVLSLRRIRSTVLGECDTNKVVPKWRSCCHPSPCQHSSWLNLVASPSLNSHRWIQHFLANILVTEF